LAEPQAEALSAVTLFFRVRIFRSLDGAPPGGTLAAEQVVRFHHVVDKLAECPLVAARFVIEFVGRHGFKTLQPMEAWIRYFVR
jgi:hypothetical protein